MAIPKSELVADMWYVGSSERTLVAQWQADKQLFLFGYQFPGTTPGFMNLFYSEDQTSEGFTPVSVLSPQLPQNWTPAQSIRASETQRRRANGQG